MSTRAEIWHLRIPLVDAAAPPLETILVRLASTDGIDGVGEAAAAPGFDGVLAENVLRELGEILIPAIERGESIPSLLPVLSPSARCAVDTALHDLRARRRGLRVVDLLGGPRRDRIPVNALLTGLSLPRLLDTARGAWNRGIRTFKIKSGEAAQDLARLRALRETFGPEARLRIDANGAWSPREAVARLRALARLDLEYVEQPLKKGELAGMTSLARETGVRIAADEDATDADAVRRIAAMNAASIVVVKLPPAGGITGASAMLRVARQAGLGTVVTGMMDTSVGLAAALHVATAAESLAGACGLGTLDLLAEDVVKESLRIEKGEMILPEGPGLGVTLDPDAIADLRVQG